MPLFVCFLISNTAENHRHVVVKKIVLLQLMLLNVSTFTSPRLGKYYNGFFY